MSNDHLSAAMMAPLKEKYLAGLRDKRSELCEFILHCKNEAVAKEQRAAMHRRAHALATQAKPFGYASIEKHGHALEALLAEGREIAFAETAECAEALLHACDAVTASAREVKHVAE